MKTPTTYHSLWALSHVMCVRRRRDILFYYYLKSLGRREGGGGGGLSGREELQALFNLGIFPGTLLSCQLQSGGGMAHVCV